MRDALQSFFFFGFTEVVCVYIHYRSFSGCVYCTIVCVILLMPVHRLHYSMCVFYYYFKHYIHTD
jgi:hypothetical protein